MKQLIATGLVILLATLIFAQKTENKKEYFKKVKLNKSIRTLNFSGIPYLDTIVNTGVNTLSIKNVNIVILPLKFQDRFNPLLLGYIEYSDNYYIIRLNSSLSKEENILVIAHEIFHLLQFYSGRLIITKEAIIFDGKYYNSLMPYNMRPFEIEAFTYESTLASEIKKKLY